MADVLGIATSGLLASKRALTTVGHNIANVNTDGYSRQLVDLGTRSPEQIGGSFFGTGVQINNVRRAYDEFVMLQLRNSTASFGQVDSFHELASRIDNLLADPDAGLAPSLQSFFNSVQDLADDPASTTARQVLLSEAETLVQRFDSLDQRYSEFNEEVNTQIRDVVAEINSLSTSIAEINFSLTSTQSAGGEANDLLDRRDLLITQLSERVSVATVEQDDGAMNVFIGNGQALVVGSAALSIGSTNNSFDASRTEVASITGTSPVDISSQITGGTLGGLLDFRARVLDPATSELGRLALGFAGTFNDQHRLGMDLNGALGGDMFSIASPAVLGNQSNSGTGNIAAAITTPENLQDSEYQLSFDGGNIYTLRRLSDSQAFTINTGGAPTFTATEVDGVTLTINTGAAVGDTFLIKPSVNGASGIGLLINDTSKIAAAVPVRTAANLSNVGDGEIDAGAVTNATAYVSDTYSLIMGRTTTAAVDGVTNGVITDDTVGPAIDNAIRYQLRVNGTIVYSQNEGDAILADLNALAGVINDDVSTTGVRAYVDTPNNRLMFVNDPPRSLSINVSEEMVDTNFPALVLDATDTVSGYFGAGLTGAAPISSFVVSGNADSYIVYDSTNNIETSANYTAGNAITFNGIQTSVTGAPNTGDSFTISNNTNGVSDNRNALSLAALQTAQTLDNQSASYQDFYAQLVVAVGTDTRQAEINRDAQANILQQAQIARETVSGVNLDEEAAEMLRLQQAFQAAAQVINTANSLFQTLINAIAR